MIVVVKVVQDGLDCIQELAEVRVFVSGQGA